MNKNGTHTQVLFKDRSMKCCIFAFYLFSSTSDSKNIFDSVRKFFISNARMVD